MRIVLEVKSSHRHGHKMLLNRQQSIEVGRSPMCDFVFEGDSLMSGRHFQLQTDLDACYLEDLKSTNGTYVNGRRVNRSILIDGDLIRAGRTELAVQIEGVAEDVVVKKTAEFGPAGIHLHATFSVARCRSGLFRHCGTTAALPVSSLAARLSTTYAQVAVVDAAKLGIPGTLLPAEPEYLFDWMPAATRAGASPLLLNGQTPFDPSAVLDRAWGQDATVVLYSELDEMLPLAQIRRASGLFVRPSIARPQLAGADPDYIRGVLTEIEAVLLEGDEPSTWQLIALQDLSDLLESFQLTRVQAAASVTA